MGLEEEFELQLSKNVTEIKKHGRFTRLQNFLNEHGYLKGAKILIQKDGTSGLTELFDKGQQQLSIENLALQEKYQPLFSPEDIKNCKRKLGIKQ